MIWLKASPSWTFSEADICLPMIRRKFIIVPALGRLKTMLVDNFALIAVKVPLFWG